MLDEAWTLSPSVALRPEPFGAQAAYVEALRALAATRPPVPACGASPLADFTP
jgi:hypothetical protein